MYGSRSTSLSIPESDVDVVSDQQTAQQVMNAATGAAVPGCANTTGNQHLFLCKLA